MSKQDRDAILQAAAKTLAWELYAVAGYGRLRTPISVERFHDALQCATRQWNATKRNLTERKEK